MKRIFSLLFFLVLLCRLPLAVYAHDVPQERNDCSIEVIVRYNGKNVSGGTLTAVKVGYVDAYDESCFFSRVFDHISLDDIQSVEAVEQLNEFYEVNKSNYDFYEQTVDVIDGKGTFTHLSTGLYLIIQEQAASNYSKLNAFLVSVPYLEDGEYKYHVTAAIKSELEQEPKPTVPTPSKPDDSKLPQTGQLNWPVPLLAVSGLILFAVGWLLRFGTEKENYEK